jgi:hypothetical protein
VCFDVHDLDGEGVGRAVRLIQYHYREMVNYML